MLVLPSGLAPDMSNKLQKLMVFFLFFFFKKEGQGENTLQYDNTLMNTLSIYEVDKVSFPYVNKETGLEIPWITCE